MSIMARSVLILILLCLQRSNGESNKDKELVDSVEVDKMKKLLEEKFGDDYGEKFIYMPDGKGDPQKAVIHPKTRYFWSSGEEEDVTSDDYLRNNVRFMLYTESNKVDGQELFVDDPKSLKNSNYDPKRKTKFIIHGWKSSGDSETVTRIRDAYLQRDGENVNIIAVDWSNISSSNYYTKPMYETENVGGYVSRMAGSLVESRGARYQDMHLIGHSLGAHVAGFAGEKSNGKIARISGLDPALPGFEYGPGPGGRLDETDAQFVEVIHTCSGLLGMSSTAGHADFYPNGGSPFQRGCCCMPEFTQACSHGRSHQYFAESITSRTGFKASACENWKMFKNGECKNQIVPMGDPTPSWTRGVFYLMTNDSAPYALGNTGASYEEASKSFYYL